MNELRILAEEVAKRLRTAGFTAYFAGGCVRDALLGQEPHDYDIATSARPEEVQRLFPKSQAVGAHFGVVIARHGGASFEIATFRTDGQYVDGRRPESVVFSSPEGDAMRRDFTVNGLFLDPETDRIIDFVHGQEDLKNRVLRAIGDPAQRFQEDHLRLMRAVRFATVLGWEIEPATWAAIKSEAHHLAQISIERIREEFVRIMLHPNRVRGLDLLDASGLLPHILPEMEALKDCTQPPEFHPEGDVWVHTRLMLSLLPVQVSVPLVLSVLLHDIAKPATRTVDDEAGGRIRFNGHDKLGAEMTEAILRRLKFSNDVIDDTVEAVANHMKMQHVQDMRVSKLKRFLASSTILDQLELHRVDCLGCHGMLDNYHFLNGKLEEFSHEPVIPGRLLNGHDLQILGYPPGPLLGRILTAVQDLQLEGTLKTKEEAVSWVGQEFPLSASTVGGPQSLIS
ncbi:MAG: HD domain-containing protein [Verrucomicrobiaceae bacterium]|nr:MAG: HD domain-containing protein [Verrucomicrobiaceae bacterium]